MPKMSRIYGNFRWTFTPQHRFHENMKRLQIPSIMQIFQTWDFQCQIHTVLFKIINHQRSNKHFLILLCSLARYSQEPKMKKFFEILWVHFEKSAILYFYWPKSWIWRTLQKVLNIFCRWHLHNASKEVFCRNFFFLNFMHGF